jgi:hypothetical protein
MFTLAVVSFENPTLANIGVIVPLPSISFVRVGFLNIATVRVNIFHPGTLG